MLHIEAENILGGLAGTLLITLLCGGYGCLLTGLRGARFFLNPLEYVGFCVLIGFIALSWLGSVLAIASLFRWWLLLPLAALLAWGIRRWVPFPLLMEPSRASSTPWLAKLAALGVLAIALWLFARPSETYLLFDDSGVYTIGGIHLAEHGTLIPSIEPFVCKGHQTFRYWGPFRWWDVCETSLSVGFLPVPKIWAAIATWLFGRGGAVWSAPFGGFLGMLALYLFLRRAAGWPVALLATLVTSLSFPQVWYSRTLMSESFTQISLFGGLYLLLLGGLQPSARSNFLGLCAALTLGLLGFIRFEAFLLLGVLLGAWLGSTAYHEYRTSQKSALPWARRRLGWIVISSLISFFLAFCVTPHYYLDNIVKVITRESLQWFVLALSGVAPLWLLWQRICPLERWRSFFQKGALERLFMLGLFLAWAMLTGANFWRYGESGRNVSAWLGLYLGWPAFLLGICGILWALRERLAPEIAALLILTLLFLILYTARPLVTRVHPWAIRRFVPFIIPTVAFGIGVLWRNIMVTLRGFLARSPVIRHLAQGILTLFLAMPIASVSRVTMPFIFYQDMAGLWDALEDLAAHYPQNAILIFDDGPIGQRLPQVMELVFGYGSIAYLEPPGPAETARLESTIAQAIAEGRRVFLNVIDGNLLWDPEGLMLQSHAGHVVQTRRVNYERIPPPTEKSIAPMQFMVDIYEIIPKEKGAPPPSIVKIPVGQGSYPFLKGGFYGVEFDAQGRPYRWTSEKAVIHVPVPERAPGQPVDVEITLYLAAWRPEGLAPTQVRVEVQGITLLETSVEHRFEPQTFHGVAHQVLGCGETFLEIRLLSDPWQPIEYDMVDQRSLGVIFYGASAQFHFGEGP